MEKMILANNFFSTDVRFQFSPEHFSAVSWTTLMDPFCVRFPKQAFFPPDTQTRNKSILVFLANMFVSLYRFKNSPNFDENEALSWRKGSVAKECKTNFCLTSVGLPLLFVHSPPECCGSLKSFKTLNGFYFLIFVAVARKHLFLSGKQILVNGNEKVFRERMDWDTSKNVKKKLKFTRHYGSQRLSLRVDEPHKSQDLLSFRRKLPHSLVRNWFHKWKNRISLASKPLNDFVGEVRSKSSQQASSISKAT